ncbi:uncharacterized protein LOC143825836 isoform X5 [Paroedura picta]|uniref:uncharacterized protein LOC143825836 isoform X5 n=1 Tax=Paroedura picta TaxID=143630 RepID=UPI004057AAC0
MWLALILLTQILHREILIPAEGQSPEPKVQLVKSKWPLKDCQGMERQSGEAQSAGCVCEQQYQVCQPLQLSAMANESVTLPCHFSFPQSWEPSHHAQVHWRLGHFHSQRYLFICCWNLTHIDQDFQGRVSLAREEGQPYTASIRIVALRESDTQLYFCRVSVETKEGKKEWQTIHGTNLTVTGHGQKRTEARAAAIEEQEEEGPDGQALRCRGVQASLREKPLLPAPGEPGLVYASLVLPDALDRKRPWGTAHTPEEESPYAAVQH